MKNHGRKREKCCTLLERCQNKTGSRCIVLKMLEKLMQQPETDNFDVEDLQKMCGG